MPARLSVSKYLRGPETLRRRELEWGRVREPPAPFYGHQVLVTRLAVLLDRHVSSRSLGQVVVSPIDVVLDAERGLVVQPDVVFIAPDRASLVRNQIWGAPDLVIEVLSAGTAERDRTRKLGWYERYGVRECWIVDPANRRIEIHVFGPSAGVRWCELDGRVRSAVLPRLRSRVATVFRD